LISIPYAYAYAYADSDSDADLSKVFSAGFDKRQ
jgi:hypothetical protein